MTNIASFTYLQRDLENIAFYMGAPHVKDAVQDFWLYMLELERNEGGIDRFLYGSNKKFNIGYAFAVLRTLAREQREVEGRYAPLNDADVEQLSEEEIPEDMLDVTIAAIDKLGRCDREMFLDYVFGIYTVREAALREGIKINAIYKRLQKTAKKLRLEVGGSCERSEAYIPLA